MAQRTYSEDACNEIIERLIRIEAILTTKQRNPKELFVDNQELLQIMNISKRTAQAWRDQKVIAFSQVGNKIYYQMGDITKLLQKHRTEANS